MFDIETLIGIVDSGRCCENDLKILTDNIYEIELKKCNKNSENNKAETEEDQLNLIDPKKLIEYIENPSLLLADFFFYTAVLYHFSF